MEQTSPQRKSLISFVKTGIGRHRHAFGTTYTRRYVEDGTEKHLEEIVTLRPIVRGIIRIVDIQHYEQRRLHDNMALLLMVQPDPIGLHTLGDNGLSRLRKEELSRHIIAGSLHDMRRDDIHLHRSGRIQNE